MAHYDLANPPTFALSGLEFLRIHTQPYPHGDHWRVVVEPGEPWRDLPSPAFRVVEDLRDVLSWFLNDNREFDSMEAASRVAEQEAADFQPVDLGQALVAAAERCDDYELSVDYMGICTLFGLVSLEEEVVRKAWWHLFSTGELPLPALEAARLAAAP